MQGLTWTSCAGACLPKPDRGICERRAARLDLSLNTDGRRCRPGRAGQEAERQKRDDDLQLIELGNSGFHGSATAGTGTFIAELIEYFRGQPAKLKHKYREELHANEVGILPYYVANFKPRWH